MKPKHKFTLLLVAALLFGAGISFAHDPHGNPDPMVTALHNLKGSEFETMFLQEMIQHHRGAIEMAKLASNQSDRQEVKQFAAKMTQMQQEETDKMTGWLKEWYNATPKEPANAASQKKMQADMAKLQNKRGQDFDKAFVDVMSRHHDTGMEMAEQVKEKGTHPELKQFAEKLSGEQKQDIKEMKSWFGPA